MLFADKIVLITGSSRGIGKEIALRFAQEGAHVILNSAKNKTQLRATYDNFIQNSLKASYFLGDLSDYAQCVDLFDYILQETGSYPDIVINNAGISQIGLFTHTTPDIWKQVIETNLYSAYYCAYLATPHMIRRHSGVIVNISSIWGNVGASCEVAYSTSKSALNGFTKALAKELGPSNIRVNAIACGWIETSMVQNYTDEEKRAFIDDIPLMRLGKVEDVANTCIFLASEQSNYMTGQIITLDGGML